jgi:hypothetical protein
MFIWRMLCKGVFRSQGAVRSRCTTRNIQPGPHVITRNPDLLTFASAGQGGKSPRRSMLIKSEKHTASSNLSCSASFVAAIASLREDVGD